MTRNAAVDVPDHHAPGRPPRKRHWWRWILASVLVLAVLLVLGGALALRLWASAAPLALPGSRAAAPAGPVDGAWTAAAGSVAGATITVTAPGNLTLRGTTRLVTVTILVRRGGTALQAAGSIPIAFSRWGITEPARYGMVGSLASHGTAEFLLLLHREAGAGRGAGP
jgi:hypothetical protein